jgi:aryl-alcohol dehydrogenase-like predicted oxidoreductase
MRLSTGDSRDELLAAETIAAAADAGITVFDTAHAYGRDETELGHNERLLADALRAVGADRGARIVTKGGMTRAGGAWVPDGRARAILAGCEASLAALDGLVIDTYLLHSPDPRTPWRTSIRALARLVDDGLVARVGVSNVNRTQLDEALELAPIQAVEVALSVLDQRALRGGLVERCDELGIALIAHSPLGGARRASSLRKNPQLRAIADSHGVTPAEVALAWLRELSPTVVAIPGARRPETARSAAHTATLALTDDERTTLDEPRQRASPQAHRQPAGPGDRGEIVLIMGIPGAGKTRLASDYVGRGFARLNRDERGGSLRSIATALDQELATGATRVVLDNTFLSRAVRSYAIETAQRHGITPRCIWLNTPLAQAQVNLVRRLLQLNGTLPTPEELRELARVAEGVMAPTSQMRALRELEPPSVDEGFADVEIVEYTRADEPGPTRAGVLVAADALRKTGWEQTIQHADPKAPHLIFDWRPDAAPDALSDLNDQLAAEIQGSVQTAVCPHGGGPPRCWCRPPLPGLALAFGAAHDLQPAEWLVIGTAAAHRTLANALGASYIPA